jgi:hypothetical protein
LDKTGSPPPPTSRGREYPTRRTLGRSSNGNEVNQRSPQMTPGPGGEGLPWWGEGDRACPKPDECDFVASKISRSKAFPCSNELSVQREKKLVFQGLLLGLCRTPALRPLTTVTWRKQSPGITRGCVCSWKPHMGGDGSGAALASALGCAGVQMYHNHLKSHFLKVEPWPRCSKTPTYQPWDPRALGKGSFPYLCDWR